MTDAVSADQSATSRGNTNARGRLNSTTNLLAQLRGNPRVPLLIAGAAAVAIIAVMLLWASSPDYRVLYNNLSDADGGRIISELDSRGIPYRFSQGGNSLLVPGDQVHTLRLQLAEQGLPQGGNVGLELMDSQAFGISQFAEHINYQRGLEGELARSMESLGPVSKARVHLAMAKPSVFVRRNEPAKASVVLTLHPGRTLGDGQIDAIAHMVSSSVPELTAEAVTVVDQNGRLLSRKNSELGDLDGTQLSYIHEVERSYQQRIERILTPILGADNIRAQVAAQIDFSTREETSERYGPNQPPNEAAVRSRQLNESYSGGDELAQGIPGALTNTPPGVAASPIDLGVADADPDIEDQAETGETVALNRLDRNDVINYEVDRNIEHIQHQRGSIERLSVAVVINYRDAVDEEGEAIRVPLEDAELEMLQDLVRQAMGFSEARGDEIAMVNSQFTVADEDETELVWWQTPQAFELATSLGRYLLVALAALFLWFALLRPLIKRNTPAPIAAAPGMEEEAESADRFDDSNYTPAERRRRSAAHYEQNLKDARELAQEDPRLVAMIVRSWMNNDE